MTRSGQHSVFTFFTFTVVLALLLPELVQQGMFMDGTQYACVAKNLAEGKGSFWFPYLSSSWERMGRNAFLEQPPLAYFIQAGFFKLFGNAFYTEKLYGLIMALLCVYLIYKTWTLVFRKDEVLKPYWWLAVLLWFITPSVFWSFRNNMLENTVSVFVLATSYFTLKAMVREKLSVVYLLIASLFLFAGSLSKGVPALFPLTLPACFYFFTKKFPFKKALLYSLTLPVVCAAIYLVLYTYNTDAHLSLAFYVKERLLNRISNDPTVNSHFTILLWLFNDLLVDLGLLVVMILVFRLKSFTTLLLREDRRLILFFLVYGLCGVLPLCLTRVQRAVYFAPAIPFFAMALAVFMARGLDPFLAKISEKALKVMRYSVLILLTGILAYTGSVAGKASRDETLLSDVAKIGARIGTDKVIGVPFDIYTKWNFQFYLLRQYNTVLTTSKSWQEPYLVFDKGNIPALPPAYHLAETDLSNFVLFVKD